MVSLILVIFTVLLILYHSWTLAYKIDHFSHVNLYRLLKNILSRKFPSWLSG